MECKDLHGTDASLEISLMEYGLLVCKNDNCTAPDEWFLIYKVASGDGYDTSYYREGEITKLMNGEESWFKPESILSFSGQTLEEFLSMPFIEKFSIVSRFYGVDNFLGTSYYTMTVSEVNAMLKQNFEEE